MLLPMLPGRLSHHGSVATRAGCRTRSSVHYLLPYRKKDQFKAYGVKKDIPRMEMVHHQDVAVELSTRLLTAQHEIETLCAQLWNADATIRGYRRMVEGQASDVTPTFYKNKNFMQIGVHIKIAYQIVVHMKNFPKINLV
jgi:hypothetical protein